MHISGDRDIKGGETESKGYYGRRLVDNTGAGKVKTPWNPKDSKAFLVDFWETKSKNTKERWTEMGHFFGDAEWR